MVFKKMSKKIVKRRYPPKKKSNLTFASKVKKIIHGQIEDKYTGTYAANILVKYAGSIVNPTFVNLCPSFFLGVDVNNRIGNKVRIMKAIINGYCVLKPYSATVNTQASSTLVKMWLCKRKTFNVGIGGLPVTADWAQFFQNGSTQVGFQSNILDMLLTPNQEWWTVYATKQFELSNASNSSPTTVNSSSTAGDMYKFSFSFAKHLGQLMYNDSGTYATNKELYLVFQNINSDGSSSVVSQELSEISYVIDYKYEDA